MNRLSLFIAVILITIASPLFAAIYNIGPGEEFGSLTLIDDDTLLMTGGEGDNLTLFDWSIATIEDTNPIIGEENGGIWEVTTTSYSIFNLSGGEINDLSVYGESAIYLDEGQILGDLTVYNDTAWVHIFGYGFNNDPFMGSPLTGYWSDDTPFSINLVDSSISTYDQIVFHVIPEPASILLFGLGGLLLRKKRACFFVRRNLL